MNVLEKLEEEREYLLNVLSAYRAYGDYDSYAKVARILIDIENLIIRNK